jgi:hypothetical protein
VKALARDPCRAKTIRRNRGGGRGQISTSTTVAPGDQGLGLLRGAVTAMFSDHRRSGGRGLNRRGWTKPEGRMPKEEED